MDARFAQQDERRTPLVGRPTAKDAGMGILYFFTSHMVIRAMYFIGIGRSAQDLGLFFAAVIVFAIGAHWAASPLLKARRIVESALDVPVVSVFSAAGAVAALVSMLPQMPPLLFFSSGAVLGMACGWIIAIWTSTIRPTRLDPDSFYIHPSLAVAVAVYFMFRAVSTLSDVIAQGFMLSLPLIAMAFIFQSETSAGEGTRGLDAGRTPGSSREPDLVESFRSLKVLIAVAAFFAIGCSVFVFAAGLEGNVLPSGLNGMTLLEVMAMALLVACCWLMRRISRLRLRTSSRMSTAVLVCVCVAPMFAIGAIMGGAAIPSEAPGALWESNIWVLIIAIFAYDIRDGIYAIKGLAVGLMFEAMCMGQVIVCTSMLAMGEGYAPVAIVASALYFGGVALQLLRSPAPQVESAPLVSAASPIRRPDEHQGSRDYEHLECVSEQTPCDPMLPTIANQASEPEIIACCARIAADFGLTQREEEILSLVAQGRSAKYVAEELTISHNTARTHIKHIYEKLNIHSKQELLDLVLFGGGTNVGPM
ncbi:MAG: helix-turn-helix transcriptional regulator [Eggerthellales bacterium]|nr:helix-turn-helix transcriptional regulator [Eggerthellales bacterium]